MAIAKRQVLIVHGWSDSYESFQPLKNLLVAAGHRTAFFVNLRRLDELRARLEADARRPFIGMNVDAVPRGQGLTYATDQLRYFRVDAPLRAEGGQPVTFFKESTSTLVDISLQGVQGPEVIQVL